MIPLQLFTLGRLRLEGSATRDALRGRRKELVLLACLARRAPRGAQRAELAALLWEERDGARARHSLRQALHNLKQAIGEGLEVGPAEVRLREGTVELDAIAFERDVAAGRLREAVERWEGDFLRDTEDAGGEVYRSWLEAERERLRRQLGWALERLTRQAVEHGAWVEAVGWAARWAELFPYEETAHIHLIEALRLAGRAGEAAAWHAAFTSRLRREVGEAPSAAFLQLGETPPESARRAEARQPGAGALLTPDMVGRGAAFAELVSAWREVEAGGSAALLIEGEEGIGKTRLCQEFLRWLRGRKPPLLLLQAPAYKADAETSHSTLRRLLAALPAAPGLAGAPDAALAELSVLLPALRERFPRLPEPSGSEAALRRALPEVLRDVAAEVPILLLLDDLPAADVASQRLVLSLLYDSPSSVLLLLTGRSDLLETTGLGAKLQRSPALRSLRLLSLNESEVEALLDSILAFAPEARRQLAQRLHAESSGNPLYTIELVTAVAEDGLLSLGADGAWRLSPDLAGRSLPMPVRIQEATRERLLYLDTGARVVLDAAAVLGPRIEPAALEAVAGLPPAEFSAALDTLISRHLLREAAAPPLAFGFTHEIVRRIAYEQLSPGRRHALQREATRALQSGPIAGERAPSQRSGAGPPIASGQRRRWTVAAALLALPLMVAAGAVLFPNGNRSETSGAQPVPVLAIGHIQDHTGDAETEIAARVADLLATNLARVPGIEVMSSVRLLEIAAQLDSASRTPTILARAAREAGAGELIEGSLYRMPGMGLRLDLRRVDLRTGRVRGSYSIDGTDVFELVDRATAQLAASFGVPAPPLRVSDVATTSLVALGSYHQGIRSYLERWGRGSDYGRNRRLHHPVRGLLLAARGEPEAAVASFRRAVFSPDVGYTRSNMEIARALLSLGQSREAVAILQPAFRGSLEASNLYVTHTELHELLGVAWEAAGRPDSAAVHYRWVLNAWKDADPQFHTRCDSVVARLRALESRTAFRGRETASRPGS